MTLLDQNRHFGIERDRASSTSSSTSRNCEQCTLYKLGHQAGTIYNAYVTLVQSIIIIIIINKNNDAFQLMM